MKKCVVIISICFIVIISFGVVGYLQYENYLYNYSINLIGSDKIEVPVNSEYQDPGVEIIHNDKKVNDYTVEDNVNTSKLGTYEVTYKIQKVQKKRIVNVVDKEKPIIKLKEPIKDEYTVDTAIDVAKLVEVTDNYDTNISDNLVIDSNLDVKKAGSYKVKYTVSDSSNNEASFEITINMKAKPPVVTKKPTVNKNYEEGIPVLMYHWFYDDTKGEKPGKVNSHNYISKTEFAKQLKYLKDNNYYFPTWDELNDYIDGKIELPKNSVILTDDDCTNSFFNVALPVLQEYEVPMTSFCITNKSNWQKYVGEPYLTFQSHTDSLHERVCKSSWNGAVMCKPYDTIYNDIKLSVEKVKNDDAFAYPFGHYNNNTIKALKENGIKLAFTINEGNVKKGANKYKLPRVRISSWTSLDAYKKLVK